MVGWSDLPADLSDTAALARLSAYLPRDAVVVSSDLVRATATADAIQQGRTRLPHRQDLREMHFGDWELRSHAEVEAEDPARSFAFWDRPGDVAPPGGESWNRLCTRANTAVDTLRQDLPGGNIVIVAHFGLILSQLQRALGVTAKEVLAHRIDNLSVTQITVTEGTFRAGRVNHRP